MVFWGIFGVVVVCVLFMVVVVYLFKLFGFMLVGGLLLLLIVWKLFKYEDEDLVVSLGDMFWLVFKMIVVVDVLMGLDNVLVIVGVFKGYMGLVILGLLISVLLVVWGSMLIFKLIGCFLVIVYVGVGVIVWMVVWMIVYDYFIVGWFDLWFWVCYVLDLLLVVVVCGGGWLVEC